MYARYAVEADIRGQPPDERQRQRQLRTRPLLGEMHGWLNDTLGVLSAKSPWRWPSKNYLPFGSDGGGHSPAGIYTLLGTAKLNDIDPQAYVRYVVERIAEHPINRIDEMLSVDSGPEAQTGSAGTAPGSLKECCHWHNGDHE